MRSSSAIVAGLATVLAASVLAQTSVDDRDPSIQYYSPGNPWTVHVGQAATFQLYNNSDTFTGVQGATITWTFTGTSIQYWGNQGPAHGPCDVAVDGHDYGLVNSNAPATAPPIKLFELTNLADGEHTIIITVNTSTAPNICELDRFVYTPSTTSPTSSHSSTPTGGSQNNSTKSSVNWGAIGGAIGGAIALIALLVVLFFFCRKRSKRNSLESELGLSDGAIAASQRPGQPVSRRPVSQVSSAQYALVPAQAGGPFADPQSASPPITPFEGITEGPGGFVRASQPPSGAAFAAPWQGPSAPATPLTRESVYSQASTTLSANQPIVSRGPSVYSGVAHPPSTASYAPTSPTPSTAPTTIPWDARSQATSISSGHTTATVQPFAAPVSQPAWQAATSSSGPSSSSAAPAPVIPPEPEKTTLKAEEPAPLVQHVDAGRVDEPAAPTPAAEELPPAYNDAWQAGQ